MGACGSTDTKVDDSAKVTVVSDDNFATPPFERWMNPKNSLVKTDASEEITKIEIIGKQLTFTLNYAYVNQRGYYPNTLNKANQDSYLILRDIFEDKSCHCFGVFDGHGETGDYCSHFAAEQFSTSIENKGIEKLYTQAFLKTNKLLKSSKIDDSLSGTTAITCLMKGEKLIIGNVGDSRAIIASEINGKLKYSPLSSDQTPFRKDERERLKLRGAQIFTIDQIEGHEHIHENWGDVWDKTLEKPGCAFTRSIGDSVAESIGVYAEPEIVTWEMQPNDKFVVIASDGVFEFLPNQTVVDMLAEYPDIIDGAKHVVNQSYELWLQNDQRTDDITIIILKFDDIRGKEGHVAQITPRVNEIKENEQARPVRKVANKARRRDISENWDVADDTEFDFEANTTSKTSEQLERVAAMVKTNFMFQHLSAAQREKIFSVMSLRDVKADEMIIREGDAGDEMYIIDEGQFHVLKKNESGVDNLVFTYTSIGAAFGELSLMYGKPRAASIQAKTDGRLWCLGRHAFRAVLMKKNPQGLLSLYKCVPVLKNVTIPKLHRLCERCEVEEYSNGDNVRNGAFSLTAIDNGGTHKSPRKHTREEGSFICSAEIGLTISKITSEGRSKIAFISKDNFRDLIGAQLLQELEQSISVPKHRGKPMKRKKSFTTDSDVLEVPKYTATRDTILMDTATMLLGDYALIAKLIFKKLAIDARMDSRMLLERNVLAALDGKCPSIPKLTSIFKDEKVIMLNFNDLYVCDLALAISQNAIDDDHKTYYSACIASAIFALHELGVMHRFINPGSIYINSKGLPKLAGLRYVKKLDGQKAYTICGDPLYFAPEVVKQQGYDYGVDLWALGCVIYEMYEGEGVMGNGEIEETQLFKKINSFDPELLEYNNACHKKVRSTITNLMDPECGRRCGYKSAEDLKQKKMFSKIDWNTVGGLDNQEFPFDLVSQADTSHVPMEDMLESVKSESFDQF
eukprot:GSChrysophyteH1.ASY1.ANO1.1154.1 assembled CDS